MKEQQGRSGVEDLLVREVGDSGGSLQNFSLPSLTAFFPRALLVGFEGCEAHALRLLSLPALLA